MAINPDMLKQLLEEFEEKQAVTAAEIGEIEKQISELQERIAKSMVRLQEVARDKDKVSVMQNRYASGTWGSAINGEIRRSEQIQSVVGVGNNGSAAKTIKVSTSNDEPLVSNPRVTAARLTAMPEPPPEIQSGISVGEAQIPIEPPQSLESPAPIVVEPALADLIPPSVSNPEPVSNVVVQAPDQSSDHIQEHTPAQSSDNSPSDHQPTDTQDIDTVPVAPPAATPVSQNSEDEESLFPFRSGPSPSPDPAAAPAPSFSPPLPPAADTAGAEWISPPAMSWDRIANTEFPEPGGQAARDNRTNPEEAYQLTPDGQNPFLSGAHPIPPIAQNSEQTMLDQLSQIQADTSMGAGDPPQNFLQPPLPSPPIEISQDNYSASPPASLANELPGSVGAPPLAPPQLDPPLPHADAGFNPANAFADGYSNPFDMPQPINQVDQSQTVNSQPAMQPPSGGGGMPIAENNSNVSPEFDIADALGGGEPAAPRDDQDSDESDAKKKKFNDALKGLFS